MSVNFQLHKREFFISGPPEDYIIEKISRMRSFYEADLLDYVLAVKKCFADGVALDVGANIGNHTIFFGAFVVDKVVCVEPNPVVLPYLKDNIAKNGIAAVIAETAVGRADGTAKLVLAEDQRGNLGAARLVADGACTAATSVEVTTLDALAGEHVWRHAERVSLVKIDVEGFELEVLSGAAELLRRDRPHLFVECATQESFKNVHALLAPYGYTAFGPWAATPVYHFAGDHKLFLWRKAAKRRLRRALSRGFGNRRLMSG